MTDNSELIDELVALGVSRPQAWMNPTGESYGGGFHPVSDDQFVRDWRVAGALMEMMATKRETLSRAESIKFPLMMPVKMFSDPRAIVEACVEALKEQAGHE